MGLRHRAQLRLGHHRNDGEDRQRELSVLAYALVADHPELDPTLPPMELVAAYRGDSATSAQTRQRLDALGLSYDFTMR